MVTSLPILNYMKFRGVVITWMRKSYGQYINFAMDATKKLKFTARSKSHEQDFLPLYPDLPPENQGDLALKRLNQALEDQEVRNIAITGNYGSGKSSILKFFAKDKQKRVLKISFSTLGASIEKELKSEEHPSKSNLIQKEIVKQILYKERSDLLPNSRFPRIFTIRIGRILVLSLLLTLLTAAALQISGVHRTILSLLTLEGTAGQLVVLYGALFLSLISLIAVILTVRSKHKIEKVSGGPISVTLSNATNYFDQYLDEILYFFEVAKYDIVVLEDIDRFKDLYIFENLRQLNTLINDSKQIGKTIRFIYAIKDSIFLQPQSEDSNEPQPHTNRTKFFDYIVPTVPFITYKNSRAFVTRMFDEYKIEPNLIRIVSRHITDMRLLKNIYNEFSIFYEKIFTNGSIPGLIPSNLFALIVYKNKFLKDFELTNTGESLLDTVLAEATLSRNTIIKNLEGQLARVQTVISSYNNIDKQSRQYGLALSAYIHELMESKSSFFIAVQVDGQTYTQKQLVESEFWRALASLEKDAVVSINHNLRQGYNNPSSTPVSITEIEAIIEDAIDLEVWSIRNLQDSYIRQDRLIKNLELTRKYSTSELMESSSDFRTKVKDLVGDELLYEMILNGYIDHSYFLYASTYDEENISANGMGFIVRILEANKQDYHYEFSDDSDIEKTLSEIDESYFTSKSFYNIQIVSFLVKTDDKRLEPILKNISNASTEDINFLLSYIKTGAPLELISRKLVKFWDGAFDFIVNEAPIEKERIQELLSDMLINYNEEIDYSLSTNVSKIICTETRSIDSLVNTTEKIDLNKLKSFISKYNLKFLFLNSLSKELKKFAMDQEAFIISLLNLKAIGSTKSLSLDNIKSVNENVYKYLLKNLTEYLKINRQLKGNARITVSSNGNFEEIINDIVSSDVTALDTIISRSSRSNIITELSDVENAAWDTLFEYQRVKNTTSNILTYYQYIGSLNKNLENYVAFNRLNKNHAPDTFDDDILKSFGIAILSSLIIDPRRKVELLGMVDINHIDIEEFTLSNSKVYGYLLAKEIIDDDLETYEKLSQTDWATREFYLSKSSEISNYISGIAFNSEELKGIIISRVLKTNIKDAILENIDTYADRLSNESATEFAQYAIERKIPLKISCIKTLVTYATETIGIELISIYLQQIARNDLITILSSGRGPLRKLVEPGGRGSINKSTESIKLLDYLQNQNIVSSFKIKANTANFYIKKSI